MHRFIVEVEGTDRHPDEIAHMIQSMLNSAFDVTTFYADRESAVVVVRREDVIA